MLPVSHSVTVTRLLYVFGLPGFGAMASIFATMSSNVSRLGAMPDAMAGDMRSVL